MSLPARFLPALSLSEFDAFVERTYPELRGHLTRRVAADDVDDVVQECFASLWSHTLKTPTDNGWIDSHERALLFRIADKRVADHWRSNARHQRRCAASITQANLQPGLPTASAPQHFESAPGWLDDLTPDAAWLVVMVSEGFSVTEIAEILDITPNAVSSRLKRTRTKVTSWLHPGRAAGHEAALPCDHGEK